MEPEYFLILVPALYALVAIPLQAASLRKDMKEKTGSSDLLLDVLSWPVRKVLSQ